VNTTARAWHQAGVNTVRLYLAGATWTSGSQLAKAIDLVREINEPP